MSKTTEEVLVAMLKENTGKHFLDSGFDNGRHWQRNQVREFEAEPSSTVEFRLWGHRPEIQVQHNVYHWLKDRLDYAEHMDKVFQRWADKPKNESKGWLELMTEFCEMVKAHGEKLGQDVSFGIYPREDDKTAPDVINTYNGEELLSQILQFVRFHVDGETYVLLQIHGGADVRGGYTRPRVFTESGRHELQMFDVAQGSIFCNGCGAYWTTDDGTHWYAEGSCGLGAKAQLETYEAVEMENTEAWKALGATVIGVTPDHQGLCPHCGHVLAASDN